MHGYAPYYSRAGILISSMNITIDSFALAPNKVFPFLLSLPSMANYVYLAFVCAEKFNRMDYTPSDFIFFNKVYTIIDFPTPVYPHSNTGFYIWVCIYII